MTVDATALRKLDATALRRQLFEVLKHLDSEGPVEILRNGRVVAVLTSPSKELRAEKPRVDPRRLARLCKKHRIRRLALFGSVTREDFTADSDVDILIDPEPGHLKTLDAFSAAYEALSDLFGRQVDLLYRADLMTTCDELRRASILEDEQVIYEA